MSADSQLDSDSLEERKQVKWTGYCSFIKELDYPNDGSINYSDNDTAAGEERENQATAACNDIKTSTPVRLSERRLSDCTNMKEDVFDLEHSCVEMSMMEREELDPQLDCTKKELFSALRHSRKKIESLQEAFDVQMSKQQHELVECCIRVGTLEKMLAQRELQLMSLLEERNSLQAEKDSLKMELQHLERQHYKELMEAQRKADALMVQELSIQRQQLDKEKDEALNSLWTRLTQEHTEELCRLKYAHWTEGEAAASLHRELKAKDQELRQLQMSMDEWKQQTTAHLADSVTEKLIPELESCKSKLIRDRNASKIKEASPDGMMHGAKESLEAVCSHLHHAIVCAAGHIHSDVSVFKLLCDLQSRVKQLLIENQVVPDMLNRNFLK